MLLLQLFELLYLLPLPRYIPLVFNVYVYLIDNLIIQNFIFIPAFLFKSSIISFVC